ncbi:C6 zinc finger domain protein [Beauveria bassiana ARSEF 2860]|uniref:C6 zinc finger domain protein n=1 Tax=Beauveria bassiana (strain ARSEF 2860) TaxID=655819 RepID=J5JEM3_BEAB2|nr:C6 zinc finger domain protein [Beauveria bassiana ARSEF 2860]EJP64293.1 C6 zinc finger domain protein [Beauveria bassiana ARSEF 2860]
MSKPREEIGPPLSPDCGSSSLASTTTPLTRPSTTSPQAPIVSVSVRVRVPVPVRVRVSGGRNGPRSRQGCWTCRTKKVKCDETRPKCLRCIRLRLLCDYEPRDDHNDNNKRTSFKEPQQDGSAPGQCCRRRAVTSQPWLLQVAPWRRAASVPTMHMPVFSTAANSLKLTSLDHEAIRYYRTTFSQRHSTKNTDFSFYSVIFTLAERDPRVMRGLLALGTRNMYQGKIESHKDQKATRGWSGLGHYSAALRMMADTISAGEDGLIDLDVALAAIYLMLMYEQKFGDAKYSGWMNHLKGAALLIQERCSDWPAQLKAEPRKAFKASSSLPVSDETTASSSTTQTPPLSVFAARMLVYFTIMDGYGSTFGLGGQVNKVMHRIAQAHDPDMSPTDAFTKLHRYSDGIYRAVFRRNYPANEMLADVANQSITDMWQACCVLRYLVADISNYKGDAARRRLDVVQESADYIAESYPELVALATEISPDAHVPEMMATNFRTFIPLYFACLLELHLQRCELEEQQPADVMTADEKKTTTATYIAVIMNLAHQIYKHAGLELLHLVTYPLFLVALQTDARSTRDWILARFQDLSAFGPNIGRAHAFLQMALKKQQETGEKINVRKEMKASKLPVFVI